MLDKLIEQLTQDLQMKDIITKPEKQHYHLPFDQNIEVEAIELDNCYLLKGVIGECPQKFAEAFLLKTMESNLFGLGTRNAVIGMDEQGKLLTLSMELIYNSSYKDFKEKLEDFVSVLSFWRKEALKAA